MKRNENGLTPKQQAFADYYLEDQDRNAKAAYLRAYPNSSENAAETNGPRMLRNAQVAAYVAKRLEEVLTVVRRRFELTEERVLEELALIGFSRAKDFFEWGPNGVTLHDCNGVDDEIAGAVAEVSETVTRGGGTVRIKLHDKVRALELLGKKLKMWTDKSEIDLNEEARQWLASVSGYTTLPPSVRRKQGHQTDLEPSGGEPEAAGGA